MEELNSIVRRLAKLTRQSCNIFNIIGALDPEDDRAFAASAALQARVHSFAIDWTNALDFSTVYDLWSKAWLQRAYTKMPFPPSSPAEGDSLPAASCQPLCCGASTPRSFGLDISVRVIACGPTRRPYSNFCLAARSAAVSIENIGLPRGADAWIMAKRPSAARLVLRLHAL
jgi:hypothetical protein